MIPGIHKFRFREPVPLASVESSLALARFAAEGVCPAAQVRLAFSYALDGTARSLLADARSEAGEVVVSIFVALLLREFGDEAFQVETVTSMTACPAPDLGLVS